MTVKGKTVVVTGAFGALGGAVAEAAAQEGAFVAALDFAATAPAGLDQRLGPDALLIGGIDLTSPQEADRAMAAVQSKFGGSTRSSISPAASAGRPSRPRRATRPGSGCSP